MCEYDASMISLPLSSRTFGSVM
jgi:hypothetical protein